MEKDNSNLKTLPYSASDIANYMIACSFIEKIPLSPMKLIKLVYIAYGWGLVFLNQKLFNEDIEAWQYGPVIPSIYHEFKRFGKEPIDEMSVSMNEMTGDLSVNRINLKEGNNISKLLNLVWTYYRNYSAVELSDLTHQLGSPWDNAVKTNGYRSVLNDDDIKAWESKVIEDYMNKN
ncbi:MAG: Panacea domain-containing protein [Rickettsiales bacterium]